MLINKMVIFYRDFVTMNQQYIFWQYKNKSFFKLQVLCGILLIIHFFQLILNAAIPYIVLKCIVFIIFTNFIILKVYRH